MNSKEYSPCDYNIGVLDNKPKPLTRAVFNSLLDGMDVRMNIEKVREHTPQSDSYKRALPGITWQSKFGGQLRTDKNAESTGLFCLDVDIHHEDHFKELAEMKGAAAAWEWGEREARERMARWTAMAEAEESQPAKPGEELDIVAIHLSPQGAGVHVVALCQPYCNSIEEDQARLARLLGTSYDKVCKDAARTFFICPREDWKYLDMETLFPDGESEK